MYDAACLLCYARATCGCASYGSTYNPILRPPVLTAAARTGGSRVAAAWEQRERMRAVVAERDATLRQLQTEVAHLTEDLGATREQVSTSTG